MWDKIVKYLVEFQSAVLTAIDADGYPYSIRCQPEIDALAHVLRISTTAQHPIAAGPAGLLCHKHDRLLWNLRSFQIKGTLETAAAGWIFRPKEFIPGAGIGGLPAFVGWVVQCRRDAKRYLTRRGLPRPIVPWDEYKAISQQVKSGD